MRYVSRIGGKKRYFDTHEEYRAFLDGLEQTGKRDRSRKKRPRIERDDIWREKRSLAKVEFERFTRPDVPRKYPRETFSVIHPTRGRPHLAAQCFYRWSDLFSHKNDLEYLMVLDSDDAENYLEVIEELMLIPGFRVVIWDNMNVVQALNNGAKVSTGDVLLYVSDDFECPPNWDLEIQKEVKGEKDWVLFVYDGIQRRAQTISILDRVYYSRTGYIYYPEYKSMFADPDFTETAKVLGRSIDAMHLTFRHNHYSIGGVPFDATYAKENSPDAWNHGEALFNRRKAENFGVKPC